MPYRLALCSEVYKLPVEDTIRRVAEIGFEGIEIAPFQLADSVHEVSSAQRAELRNVARDAGIEVIGLHWLLVAPKGLHLTSPDASIRRKTFDYLIALAQLCADLGGKFLVLGSPKQRNIAPGGSHTDARDHTVTGLRGVGKACGQLGVKLLIEPLHPAETNFIQTVEEAISLASDIGEPAVGYIIDCKAMSGMPRGIVGTILEHGKTAGHFHANEPSGLGPGMGDVSFLPILSALAKSGYEGWVSSEPFNYEPDADTVARTALVTLSKAQD